MSDTSQIPEVVEDKDSENACMKCRCKQCGKSTEFSSAKRKVAVLTAVCCILCVLTISACCCSLYLFTRFQGFRQELVALVRAQTMNADADDAFADHFPMDHNALPLYGEDLESDDDSEDSNLIRHRRKKEKGNAEKQVNGKKRKGGKGGGKCRKKDLDKMCKCCTDSVNNKFTELEKQLKEATSNTQASTISTTTGSPSPQQQFAYVAAAHYTTYVDEAFINTLFGPLSHNFDQVKPDGKQKISAEIKEKHATDLKSEDNNKQEEELQKYMPDWQGTLYRNRSFITTASPQTLKVFQESSWMKDQSSMKLFDYDNKSGKFKALHTGLYHLYAHVLFYDVKAKMAIGLSHQSRHGLASESKGKETMVFRCMESVDYVDQRLTAQFMITRERGIAMIHREPGGFKILNTFECGNWTKIEGLYGVGKPCTVGGVVLVKERETFEVVLVDEGHVIGVDPDNDELYFGAFLIRTS